MQDKLWGTLSVADMADPNKQDECFVKGYKINSELRFNFHRNHRIPQAKKATFLDHLMKDKAKIPSPDKYLCNVHRKNFNDMTKKSRIYAFER